MPGDGSLAHVHGGPAVRRNGRRFAHASVIDTVAVYGNSKADAERWGTAWDLCRAQNIKTHSIKIEGPGEKTGLWGPGLPNRWVAYWGCYDTTNTTSLP